MPARLCANANTSLAGFPVQMPVHSEPSSSEGSTVDIRPLGEGGESLDMEPESSLDPEGCFPDGETTAQSTHS